MILLRLALSSLISRRITAGLTVFSIALSVALLLGVEKVRVGAKASFSDTISGTDLIVGARSGGVQLLLYAVFHIGNATNNITWQSYEEIAERGEVDWIVPISLGDSHRGFRVMGTTPDFFKRYKYRSDHALGFAEGVVFDDLFDAVIGADVANALGYDISQEIVIAHGVASFLDHDDKPFRVVGILKKTGTPVDRTVIVSLEAIEAIHVDWQGGGRSKDTLSAEAVRYLDLRPKAVSAAMIGVNSKLQIFALQRWVNNYSAEALLAIIPGVSLATLWEIVGVAERALIGVSALVVGTALLGMAAMIFSGLNERRREMAILRSVGARPLTIVALLAFEAAFISIIAVLVGVLMVTGGVLILQSYIDTNYGLYLVVGWPTGREIAWVGAIIVAGTAISLAPALRAYQMTLADGMNVKS